MRSACGSPKRPAASRRALRDRQRADGPRPAHPRRHPQRAGRAAGDGRLDQCGRPPRGDLPAASASSSTSTCSTSSAARSRSSSTCSRRASTTWSEFHEAGGVPRLLKEVRAHLDDHCADRLRRHHRRPHRRRRDEPGQTIIRTVARPLKPIGTLAVLHGNLAPRGAIIKQTAASKTLMQHSGRAVVFDSVEDMAAPHRQRHLDVEADDILVLRNAGQRARRACRRPATCRSRASWRGRASRTWSASPTPG